MDNILMGDVVRSTHGKDKEMLFVVFGVDEDYVYIVNGKQRKISLAKKKKKKHVIQTEYKCDLGGISTDKGIRRFLSALNSKPSTKGGCQFG